MQPLLIRLSDPDVRLAVPPTLSSITTYVLLEQEAWFEKEPQFLRRWLAPGMTVIDIGANLGVYALPMARLVGPQGRVFAYEPGREARGLLEQSRDINGASNLDVFALALSDRARAGRLVAGASTELSLLGSGDAGEPVQITALDVEDARRGWESPDFVKIDAEGEEDRIVAGARAFFARHSPLVMFEIKAKDKTNTGLLATFRDIGYRLFRLLAGAPILVPFDAGSPLDNFELNLFAAKPDRVKSLCQAGVAVAEIPVWQAGGDAIGEGLSLLRRQAFASAFGRAADSADRIDPDYATALAAYAAWRNESLPAAVRAAALNSAYRTLAALCNRSPTTARYSTFARLAWEGGWRSECVVALQQMAGVTRRIPFEPTEPCWPANPRFDRIPAGPDPARWFTTGLLEQLEKARGYSSQFADIAPWLGWLCEQPTASHEMHRRRTLLAARQGQHPVIPACLRAPAGDHINADLWRNGAVPGTRV
jgi:FkbM family methyltransferase